MNKFVIYFYLAYVIIKPSFAVLISSFDGAGRIELVLSFFILLMNLKNKIFLKIVTSSSVMTLAVWGIYSTINWLAHGIPDNTSFMLFCGHRIYLVWFTFVLIIYQSCIDFKSLSKFLVNCFLFYVIIGLAFQSQAVSNDGRGGEILGNYLPLNALCMVAVSIIAYISRNISSRRLIIVIILSLLAIFLVATRKAFGGLLILILSFLFYKYPIRNLRNLILLVLGASILYYISTILMSNTLLGERMLSIQDEGNELNSTNITWLNFLGDRAYFYVTGWKLFIQNPVFGIGLDNYRYLDPVAIPIHSEYIVQLTENGIVGFLLFFFFYYKIFILVVRARRYKIIQNQIYVFLGWFIVLAFICLTAWIYEFKHYFIVLGLIVGYIYNRSNFLRTGD